jgi:hypothetical protein
MKQKITTGMLLISALLLGAFIWFVERNSATSAQQDLLDQKVFKAYPGEISWIRLERGDTVIECLRTAGSWRMTHPVDAPVDNATVAQMVNMMAHVERGELITEETMKERGITAADYGFDEPRATITFRNSHGTFTWLIGRDAPLGDSLYIMEASSHDVIATSKQLLNLVPPDPALLRDRTLFQYSPAAVRGIDLRRTGGIIQLRQNGDNHWMIQQPITGDADLPQVSKLIDHAVTASITDFILEESSDLTVYGLEEPAIELTLLDKNDVPQTLQIGKTRPDKPKQQYAKWANKPAIFTVSDEWVAAFELNATLLRSRSLLEEQPERITAISISADAQWVDLVRTNNQWRITRPASWDADPKSVESLLDCLNSGTINEFIDSPDAELLEKTAKPRWVVQLTANNKTRTLKFTPVEDRLIVQRDEETTRGVVDAYVFGAPLDNPLNYRTLTLLQINPKQIKSLVLQTTNGTFQVEQTEGEFISPDRTRTPNQDALTRLTTTLANLRSDRLVAFNPDSLEPYGLDHPETRLTLTLTGTNALGQVILFGNQTATGRYAMLRGQPLVFILPEKTAGILTQEPTQSVENQSTETDAP